MKGDIQPSEELLRARLLGRRAGLGVLTVAATVFIGISTAQITSAVFGLRTVPLASGSPESPERRCALGISQLLRALDRPAIEAGPTAHGASPSAWDDAEGVQRTCGAAKGGLDAWASLLRLRAATLELDLAGPDELLPLRRDVAAHLPADLR